MRAPCYNIFTKEHCPDRVLGCHCKCEKWKAYEQARNAEYEKRVVGSRGAYVHKNIARSER